MNWAFFTNVWGLINWSSGIILNNVVLMVFGLGIFILGSGMAITSMKEKTNKEAIKK